MRYHSSTMISLNQETNNEYDIRYNLAHWTVHDLGLYPDKRRGGLVPKEYNNMNNLETMNEKKTVGSGIKEFRKIWENEEVGDIISNVAHLARWLTFFIYSLYTRCNPDLPWTFLYRCQMYIIHTKVALFKTNKPNSTQIRHFWQYHKCEVFTILISFPDWKFWWNI